MQSFTYISLLLSSFLLITRQQYTPDYASLDTHPLPKWYDESKIGIFIHWGLYSVISISSEWMWWNWQGSSPNPNHVAYMKKYYPSDWTYADFGPQFRADLYDPNEWADLFAASGAKYVVLTSKHHEGYAMWPSTYSFNWNSMDVGPKRDLLGELAAAIRNRTNLVFGAYYSLFEWFNPVYLLDKSNNFTTQYFSKGKFLPEIRELVEKYKPEIVWSDGEWETDEIYWKSLEFLAWLYNESPVKDTVVVNDRWGNALCKHGDFFTCLDRYNPGILLEHKWENCFTIDKNSWAYRLTANIEDYMTIEEILNQIVTTVSTGGNALVNVGPDMHGKIPTIFQERLRQMGSWLKVNGEAIYATIPWKYQNDTINSDVWYTSSNDGKFLYGFILVWPKNTTQIRLGAPSTTSNTVVRLLGSNGDPVPWSATSGTRGMVIDVSKIALHLLESDWIWTFKLENLSTEDIIYPPGGHSASTSSEFSLLFSAVFFVLLVRICRSTELTEQTLITNVAIQHFIENIQFTCPNKLQGCPAKVLRSGLAQHKQSCPYAPEKLTYQREQKLSELRLQLQQYSNAKTRTKDKDNAFYDLAKVFHEEHGYDEARQCLKMIRGMQNVLNIMILSAQIEQDDGQYDKALEIYTDVYLKAKSNPQRIELLLASGHIYLKKAKYIEAQDKFMRALKLLPHNDQSQKKAEILNSIGLFAKKCSDYDQAISSYNEALETVDTNSNLWSEIVANLADIFRKKGNYNESYELYLKVLKQLESVHGHNHPLVADVMNNLGILLKKEGKYTEALDYLKRALKISKHYYGHKHESIGMYLGNIGDIYRKRGDYKTAEVIYKEALAVLEESFGPKHIEVAEILNSMGLALEKRGDYDGAQVLYERAIKIIKDTFGPNQEHYKLGIYYNNLADLDRKRSNYDDALRIYRRASTIIEKTLGPEHSEAAEILHNIGQVQLQLGNYKQAMVHIDRALAIIKKEFNDQHYKYGIFLNSLGLVYAVMNDYDTAYVHVKQALQILLDTLDMDHIELCDVYTNMGDICMKIVAEIDKKQKDQQQNQESTEKQVELDEAKKYYSDAHRIIKKTFGDKHTKTQQSLALLSIVDNY